MRKNDRITFMWDIIVTSVIIWLHHKGFIQQDSFCVNDTHMDIYIQNCPNFWDWVCVYDTYVFSILMALCFLKMNYKAIALTL
jgi:hypothetical protein